MLTLVGSIYGRRDRLRAVALGASCHVSFGVAIAAMIVSLHEGMRFGQGRLTGMAAWLANLLLCGSFPLLHSWLLTPRGARWLDRVAEGRLGRDLRTTSFALITSVHVLLVFALWSPAGSVLWRASGAARWPDELLFAASWLLVVMAMRDASLAVQTGFLGWSAVARGNRPSFPAFTPRGLFRFTRQPIYVAFVLTLWTGRVVTTDRLLIAAVWTLYCVLGPVWKEARLLARDPDRYRRYQRLVPYWVPRLTPPREEL
jgi:protein-S-isoprenylcysteine O-methyltransferase Ste14